MRAMVAPEYWIDEMHVPTQWAKAVTDFRQSWEFTGNATKLAK
jgi:hypothetical protein